MVELKGHLRELATAGIIGGFLAGIMFGIFPLGLVTYNTIVKAPESYTLAVQSHSVQLADPNVPLHNLTLTLNMGAFTFGAQSNITAFAKVQPTNEDRKFYAEQNYTIAERYFLWFADTDCPIIPVPDLYAPFPECKIELERYPRTNADWSNVHWQGNFSDFRDELTFSTTGIRYSTEGIYAVGLSLFDYEEPQSYSEPFIRISDAGVTQAFFARSEAVHLGFLNFGITLLILLVAIIPLYVGLFFFLRKKGIF